MTDVIFKDANRKKKMQVKKRNFSGHHASKKRDVMKRLASMQVFPCR